MEVHVNQLITNVLGFLLLFWALKRLAWGPILAFMDERRDGIANDFEKIKAGQNANEELRAELDRQLREVDATARKKIEEASAEGARLAAQIKEEAHAEARKLRDKATADIEHEHDKARIALRNDIVQIAILGAEKILKQKLEGRAQEDLVNRFIDDLDAERAGGVGQGV